MKTGPGGALLILAFSILPSCHLRSCAPSSSTTHTDTESLNAAVAKLLRAAASEDEDSDTAEESATALAALGEPAIPTLAAALTDPDENVRVAAVQALAKIGTVKAVDPLLAALKDESSQVRLEAAEGLGPLQDRRAVQPLIDLFHKDDSRAVQYNCVMSLGTIGDPAASPLLASATRASDPYLRMWSMLALCKMNDPQAADLVLAVLDEPNADIRGHVLTACPQALDTPRGHEALIGLAVSADFMTGTLARQALAYHRKTRPPDSPLTEQMRQAGLRALRAPAQRRNAAFLLGDVRDPAAVDELIAALRDPNVLACALAARQLGQIGDRRAVPELTEAIADPRGLVAAMAFNALQWFAQDGDPRAREAVKNYQGKKFDQPLPR